MKGSSVTCFEDETAKIWLEDVFIHFIYKTEIVDLPTQMKHIQRRQLIANGKPRPIIADATTVKYWTKEAKDFSIQEEQLKYALSFAIINPSIVGHIHINWILKFMKPKVPMRFFTTKEAAIVWSRQFLIKDNENE